MTISVIDAAGTTQTVQTINDLVAGGMIVTIGSSIRSAVALSSGIVTPSSALTVTPSSALTVAGAVTVTGSVTLGSNPTVAVSSGIVTPSSVVAVQLQTATTGGVSANHYITVASTLNATVVKNQAGTLYALSAQNIGTAAAYLKLYNKATAPTSADTPALTYLVPFSSVAGYITPLINPLLPGMGVAFGTGISFWTTANSSDPDNTVAVPVLVLNVYWV